MGYASGTMDVTRASREELIALVAQLQATVQRLEERIRELEGGGGRPKGMPGLKPGARPARPDKPPRKKRAVNCARRRLPPTRRVTRAAAHCPGCGAPLCGGTPKRTREVIELPPPAPVVVTEHVYLERRCPDCRKRVVPPAGLPAAALRVKPALRTPEGWPFPGGVRAHQRHQSAAGRRVVLVRVPL